MFLGSVYLGHWREKKLENLFCVIYSVKKYWSISTGPRKMDITVKQLDCLQASGNVQVSYSLRIDSQKKKIFCLSLWKMVL